MANVSCETKGARLMSIYLEHYVTEEGKTEKKLSLSSEGFACLTEDLEDIINKYTGIENSGFMQCSNIRLDTIDLINEIINKK